MWDWCIKCKRHIREVSVCELCHLCEDCHDHAMIVQPEIMPGQNKT